MPDSFPVFLNGQSQMVAAGTTVRQLLTMADPDLAGLASDDGVTATDGRGIAILLDAQLAAGSILRVFRSARQPGAASDE